MLFLINAHLNVDQQTDSKSYEWSIQDRVWFDCELLCAAFYFNEVVGAMLNLLLNIELYSKWYFLKIHMLKIYDFNL